jgi:hypothetical protein
MIRSEIENSVEFIRLQKAIKSTMVGIAYHAFMRSSYDEDYTLEKRYRKVCDDVDTAFSAIDNCFEDFGSICDTMCRDFATSEIYLAIEQCDTLKKQDKFFEAHKFLQETITCESVFEDILDMNSDDFCVDIEETDE